MRPRKRDEGESLSGGGHLFERGHASSDSLFFSPSQPSRSREVIIRDWASNVPGAVSTPRIPCSNVCSCVFCFLFRLSVHARTTMTPSSTFFSKGRRGRRACLLQLKRPMFGNSVSRLVMYMWRDWMMVMGTGTWARQGPVLTTTPR